MKNLSARPMGSRPSSFLLMRMDLAAFRQRLGYFPFGITLLHHMPRKQARQLSPGIHYWKRAERKCFFSIMLSTSPTN